MILPEIVSVGIYNSQIAAKNTAISKKRKTSMFEIELPMESGGISYMDSAAVPITADMIICAKPGQVRHTKFPFKCYYIHIILQKGALCDTLEKLPDFFKTDKREIYQTIFSRLVKHFDAFTAEDEIMLQSLLLELIYTLSRDAARLAKRENDKNSSFMIEKALKHIKEHLTEDLRLEKVAEAVSLSPVYFHNTFKKAVGKTLRDFVEEQRIKKAINLLQTSDDSLTKIAFECGFSSQSYFSYVFKRRMKQTPREYVKELCHKYEI